MSIVTVSDVRDQGFGDPPYSDPKVTQAIEAITEYIESVTGNWFDVRTLTLHLDGSGFEALMLPHPIVSISEVKIFGEAIDLDDVKVYNRHLQGYKDPDDRQDPKIEFVSDLVDRYASWQGRNRSRSRRFPEGPQNIEVTGKFGYRDYDPGNVEGKVPIPLKQAFYMLLPRFIENAASPYLGAAWRSHELAKKSTRGQSCENRSAVTAGVLYGGLTGDLNIDRILSLYVSPIGGAVV